jgi:hypothetical protein
LIWNDLEKGRQRPLSKKIINEWFLKLLFISSVWFFVRYEQLPTFKKLSDVFWITRKQDIVK